MDRPKFVEKKFLLSGQISFSNAVSALMDIPIYPDKPLECVLREKKDTRTLDMNAKFHAICGDIAKSNVMWAGKRRTGAQWKVLLVSGHAVATKEEAEIVPGLEGEFINIRESTALMSIKRGSSLIEYALAWCAMNNVRLSAKQEDIR